MASAARLAAAATWRVAHPRLRESYVEQPKPQAVPRLYYRTHDGWQIPIKVLPVLPGKTGEPVLLAAGLGFDSGLFRYGRDGGFAGLLQAAGFQVYLLGHRGSPEAIAPQTGPLEVSFDHIVERDLEPAVERVLGHSGAQRLLWFGDALGGQLGLVAASGGLRERIAALAVMDAPVYFAGEQTSVRKRVALAKRLPGHWKIPSHGCRPSPRCGFRQPSLVPTFVW